MKILVAFEKHETRFFDATDGPENAARALAKERLRLGYWYGEEAADALTKLLDDPKSSVWNWLRRRSGYEYERVELAETEDATP